MKFGSILSAPVTEWFQVKSELAESDDDITVEDSSDDFFKKSRDSLIIKQRTNKMSAIFSPVIQAPAPAPTPEVDTPLPLAPEVDTPLPPAHSVMDDETVVLSEEVIDLTAPDVPLPYDGGVIDLTESDEDSDEESDEDSDEDSDDDLESRLNKKARTN